MSILYISACLDTQVKEIEWGGGGGGSQWYLGELNKLLYAQYSIGIAERTLNFLKSENSILS